MNITLTATFTRTRSTSPTGHDGSETVTDFSLSGERTEIQGAIDELFDAEQAAALRRVWGLKQPQAAESAEAAEAGGEEDDPSRQPQFQTIEDAVMDIRRLLIYTLGAISSAGLAEATRGKSLRLPLE